MKKILNTKLKDMKAITLVALVITIVVLIILAGVIINITLGNGGIIDRTKTAKEQYQNAQDYEETEIAKVTNKIDSYVDGNREVNLSDDVKNYIDSKLTSKTEFILKFETTTSSSYRSLTTEELNKIKNCKFVTIGSYGLYDNQSYGFLRDSTTVPVDILFLNENSINAVEALGRNGNDYSDVILDLSTDQVKVWFSGFKSAGIAVYGTK